MKLEYMWECFAASGKIEDYLAYSKADHAETANEKYVEARAKA